MLGLVYETKNKDFPGSDVSVVFKGDEVARIKAKFAKFGSEHEFEFDVYSKAGALLNKAPLLSINHAKAVVEYYLQLKS